MSNLNECVFIGNLPETPELRSLPSGSVAVNTRLMTTRSYRQNDEWKDDTQSPRITLWGKQAERFAGRCRKGDLVYVRSRYQERKYENKDGDTRYVHEFVVGYFMLLKKGKAHDEEYYDEGGSQEYAAAETAEMPF